MIGSALQGVFSGTVLRIGNGLGSEQGSDLQRKLESN